MVCRAILKCRESRGGRCDLLPLKEQVSGEGLWHACRSLGVPVRAAPALLMPIAVSG
jgi:hypothetical protein